MKYVGDRGRRSAASSVIPAAQSLFRQTLLQKKKGPGDARAPDTSDRELLLDALETLD